MINESSSQHKTTLNSKGLGEFGNEELAQRAHELARSDGREQPQKKDFQAAAQDLVQPGASINHADNEFPETTGSGLDSEPVSHGHRAERHYVPGERNVPDDLTREGIAEADHETRSHSLDDEEPL